MIVFNLTDKAPLGREASPHAITVCGKVIPPGGKEEFESVPLAKMSGMIYVGKVAIDHPPVWYINAKRARRRPVESSASVEAPRGRAPAPQESTEESEGEPAPRRYKRKKRKGE